jgi:hypothetical protein
VTAIIDRCAPGPQTAQRNPVIIAIAGAKYAGRIAE